MTTTHTQENAMTATTREDLKAQITEMATRIKVDTHRNTLTFRTLFQAEQAAALFRQAGLACTWWGGNQPVLTTAADFPAKDTEVPGVQVADLQALTTTAPVRDYADLRVWFAVNETTGPIPEGARKHRRLCAVVDELRRRGVMEA